MKTRNIVICLIFFLMSCATTGKDSEMANAHYQVGLSYLNENKIQMAYVEFQKAIELNPDDKEALNALGVVYLQFDDLQKAEGSFLKAIKVDSSNSEFQDSL